MLLCVRQKNAVAICLQGGCFARHSDAWVFFGHLAKQVTQDANLMNIDLHESFEKHQSCVMHDFKMRLSLNTAKFSSLPRGYFPES